MSQPVYDPQLANVLALIGDFVPTGMTLDRLPYFEQSAVPPERIYCRIILSIASITGSRD